MSMRGYFLNTVMTLSLVLSVFLISCATGPAPAKTETPDQTPAPVPTPEDTTFTATWARNQVSAYLYRLATGPNAIRYLAELNSEGHFEARFNEREVGQDIGEHKFSGWSVYFIPHDGMKDRWQNLNWAVFEDGYVVEGSNDALLVKADLIELSQ